MMSRNDRKVNTIAGGIIAILLIGSYLLNHPSTLTPEPKASQEPAESPVISEPVDADKLTYVDEKNGVVYTYDDDTGCLTVSPAEGDTTGIVVKEGWFYATEEAYERNIYHRLCSIVLEEGIVEIGKNAFCDCPNLGAVTFPASLEKIGDLAFANCPKLATVAGLADTVTMGKDVFYTYPTLSGHDK